MTCRDSYITSVDTATARFEDALAELESFDTIAKKQQTPSEYLDQDDVRIATTMLNTIIRDPNFNVSSYPSLSDRISNGPITTVELGDFAVYQGYISLTPLINDMLGDYTSVVSTSTSTGSTTIRSSTTPSSVTSNSHIPEIASELDRFYSNNYAASKTGNMCGLFNQAFADISAIGQLVGKASDSLSSIEDFSFSGLKNKVKPLESLKKAVDGMVDDMIGSLQDRVERVVETTQNAMEDLEQLTVGVAKDINCEAQRLQRLLSNQNGEKLKVSMDKYLADAVGQFEDAVENPDLIPYLAYRTCQTINDVQNVFEQPVNAFADRLQTRLTEAETLNRHSDESRALLTSNGGPQITRVQAASAKRTAYGNLQGKSSGGVRVGGGTIRTRPAGNTPIQYPLTGADIAIGNKFDIERDSSGRFTKVSNRFITLQPQVMNEGIDYPYYNDDDGWTMVDERVWALAYKLGEKLGKQLSINSAYRCPAKNAAVGGASNSFHKQGMAIDISSRNVDPVEIVKHASLLGFMGIGGYGTFIHVDIRSYKSTWSSNASDSVKEALRIHKSDVLTFDDETGSAPTPTVLTNKGTPSTVV